ncbi:MAG: hypothetical protein KFF73_18610 [Cyclobacteriaceae bacterium]|nr:hypothetical protein [Cyclobacteriaceae bacterium]
MQKPEKQLNIYTQMRTKKVVAGLVYFIAILSIRAPGGEAVYKIQFKIIEPTEDFLFQDDF